MTNDVQIALRLPRDLVKQIDAAAKRLSDETALVITRSGMIRRCLHDALRKKSRKKT